MYLSLLQIKNFRCFDGNEHSISFKKGLNVLVGENDSGKSTIMDAIKLVLGTTDMNWYRVDQEDFYQEDTSLEIKIVCKFEDLNDEECGAFLECVSYEDEKRKIPSLYLHWRCKYLASFKPPRPVANFSTGISGNGPAPSVEARELLRITYLRALRDAFGEMQAGKHSRLSQIMQHVSAIDCGDDEYEDGKDIHKLSIAGIAELSNMLLENHSALEAINNEMTSILQQKMLLKKDIMKTRLEVAGANASKLKKEMALLEKLDLAVDKNASGVSGRVGLGTSNIMSMACELLLHKEAAKENKSCFLLIEEPEAHIHAQRQLKLIQSLEEEAERGNRQTIITTHAPLLASVVKLSNIMIVKSGEAFSLSKEFTKLADDDYLYLEKYLDATKANLFFARNVIIVEGPGEALLLPTLSRLLGYSFTDYGTSLVDVRSTGLRRYARIFQRKDEKKQLDINVACITDRDVMPNCAPNICIDDKEL
ncbi:ATP-dependent endonuclease [uncultured Acetatifactor sp.]|uniref:ATP-dependent nuclease n=1 Tax=uncultured Acetatifactor sp. TaxID=1671927 RepID=UPI002635EDF5|nr:AAA family ATPase [uncultured Acetatifactor sp.]